MPNDLDEEISNKLHFSSDPPSDTSHTSLKSPVFDLARLPRVYLDTAALMRFADGCEPSLVDRFRQIFSESCAVLVLSEAHLMDLSRAEDLRSVWRVIDWIDGLPRKVFAPSPVGEETQAIASALAGTSSPIKVELKLQPIDSFRGYIESRGDHFAKLRMTSQFLPMMTNCMQIIKRLLSDTSLLLPSHRQETWGIEFVSILERGDFSRLIVDITDACERYEISVASMMADIRHLSAMVDLLSSKEGMMTLVRSFACKAGMSEGQQDIIVDDVAGLMKREGSFLGVAARMIVGCLRVPGGSVRHLVKTQAFRPRKPIGDLRWASVKGGNDRWLQEASSVAPALFLGACLALERMKDTRAPYLVSDWADDVHVGFLPYVDIVTLDSANLARLNKAISVIRAAGRAKPKVVVGNPRLDEAIMAIGALGEP